MTDFEWLLFWAEGALFWATRPDALVRVRHNLRQLDLVAATMPAELRQRATRFAGAVLTFAEGRAASEIEAEVRHAA